MATGWTGTKQREILEDVHNDANNTLRTEITSSDGTSVAVSQDGHMETEIHGPLLPFGSVQPGEMITVAARSLSGTPAYVVASLNTKEEL